MVRRYARRPGGAVVPLPTVLRPLSRRPYADFVPRLNKLWIGPTGGPGGNTAEPPSAHLRTALTDWFSLPVALTTVALPATAAAAPGYGAHKAAHA